MIAISEIAGEKAVSLKKERSSGRWQVLQRQHGDLLLGSGDKPNPWLAKIITPDTTINIGTWVNVI